MVVLCILVLFNNFTSIFLCLLTTIWSVSLSLFCRGYRWLSQYDSNNRKISARGTMRRGKRRESRFLPSPFLSSPARFILSFSPASLRQRRPRRKEELTSDYFFVLLYSVYHVSTLISFRIISLCIRPLLGFKKSGTHASVLFVVKQQKSGECKFTTSATAIFPRSSWPSRSPWIGSKFRSSRAKLLSMFFFFLLFIYFPKKNYT